MFAAPSSIEIPLDNGTVWDVSNAEGSSYGSLTLGAGHDLSVNTVYAQLIDQLGAQTGRRRRQADGHPLLPARVASRSARSLPYLSAVLGHERGQHARDGVRVRHARDRRAAREPRPGDQHRWTRDGEPVWQASPKPKQVVDPAVAAAADEILQEVVLYGTGTAANIGRPQIGKTGTDQNYADAWFVGAIPQLVAAVWVGFPQGQISMYGGVHADHGLRRDVAGADLATVHGAGGRRPARCASSRRPT